PRPTARTYRKRSLPGSFRRFGPVPSLSPQAGRAVGPLWTLHGSATFQADCPHIGLRQLRFLGRGNGRTAAWDHGGHLAPMALCTSTARSRGGRGVLARLLVLVPLLAALGGCSMWSDFWGDKDQILPDEPADRLYNEGVYLMNEKKDFKDSAKKFEEVD